MDGGGDGSSLAEWRELATTDGLLSLTLIDLSRMKVGEETST